MTRSLVRRMAALLGVLAALSLATSVSAGGWAVVVLDSASARAVEGGVQPEAPLSLGFTVLQHGDKPMSGLAPLITFTPQGGGAPVTFTAAAEGAPGHYIATIALPAAGVWRWQIDAFGPPSPMAPITVAAAAAPATPAPAISPAALLAAAAALGLLGLTIRSARRPAVAPQ